MQSSTEGLHTDEMLEPEPAQLYGGADVSVNGTNSRSVDDRRLSSRHAGCWPCPELQIVCPIRLAIQTTSCAIGWSDGEMVRPWIDLIVLYRLRLKCLCVPSSAGAFTH